MAFTTPRGFRDVLPEEALWREQITQAVGSCFARAGYLPVETPVLEESSLLRDSDIPVGTTFRLFDSDASQLIVRPDVTLPVARMVSTRLRGQEGPFRLRYAVPVVRESESLRGVSRQFTELGVEFIGVAGAKADAEVLLLMTEAIEAAGVHDYIVAMGSVTPLEALLKASGCDDAWCARVRGLCSRCDLTGLRSLVDEGGVDPALGDALCALPRIHGGRDAVARAAELLGSCGCVDPCLEDILDLLERAERAGVAGHVSVDFSVVGSFGYYTGMVLEAYVPSLGIRLGQGGRYDDMLARFGQDRPAVGFALSLDSIQAALEHPAPAGTRPLRIAVSKGSLFPDSVDLLGRAGFDVTGLADPGRQLIVRGEGVEYIIVRPTDAPVFVANGGADCGICGRDSLFEAGMDVLELVNLGFGACRFVVAEPADAAGRAEANYRRLGSIRVATKYPRIAGAYYARMGVEAEILKLHGNIELAPLVGMADRIIDITATGATLRQNNLVVVDDVMTCTARFFANPAAARTDPRVFEAALRLERAAAAKAQEAPEP